MDNYFAQKAISASLLKAFILKSPAHAALTWHNIDDGEDSRALVLGSALHTAVLEPHLLGNYALCPPRNTKAGKEFAKANADKVLLTETEWSHLLGMAARITLCDELLWLAKGGVKEQAHLTTYKGQPAKIKPDIHVPDTRILDVKTAKDVSPRAFARSCYTLGYHIQAAWYMDVLESMGQPVSEFLFVAIEKTRPYSLAIYKMDEAFIEAGRQAISDHWDALVDCIERDVWPDYLDMSTGVQTIYNPYPAQ